MPRGALALVALLGGCAEEPLGPLDPEVVAALATEVGDAVGIAPSGVYAVELVPETCGCQDASSVLAALTVCPSDDGVPFGGSDLGLQTTFDVVVADGVLELSSDVTTSAVGALDADGTFDTGAVTRLTSIAATGYQIIRVDGTLSPVGDNDYDIEGELRIRLLGEVELTDLEGVVDGVEGIDCEDRLTVRGSRYIIR